MQSEAEKTNFDLLLAHRSEFDSVNFPSNKRNYARHVSFTHKYIDVLPFFLCVLLNLFDKIRFNVSVLCTVNR